MPSIYDRTDRTPDADEINYSLEDGETVETNSHAFIWLPIEGVDISIVELKTSHAEDTSFNWVNLTTTDDVWERFPDKIRHLISELDLNYPGMEPVSIHLQNADTVAAAGAIVEYFKNGDSGHWLRGETHGFSSPEERQSARKLLDGKVTRRGLAEKIPTDQSTSWDWSFTGQMNDAEVGYYLNKQEYLMLLLKGWHETGDEVYVETFDRITRDWIIHNPLPDEDDIFWEVHRTTTEELDWRDIGPVAWRDLDAGVRIGNSWMHTFFGFQQSDAFTPAARLLMLYSIYIHADYIRHYHKTGHNWTTMEMNGLGLVGITLPEFKKSGSWADYALKVMEEEIYRQVYPDGVQTELTTSYHQVSLNHFETMLKSYQNAGRSVSARYIDQIEAMYDYLAWSMRPDGHQPLNNDSDRNDVRSRILQGADMFDRSDWVFIATNGSMGVQPDGLPSRVFPWSGIHVMRNGWDRKSHWGFFHTGPYGTGHQHRDKLHLSIHAYGRDLLVDTGRSTHENYFSFDPANWRGYFRSSFSQNVILVDGAGQNAWETMAETPLIEGVHYINTADFDYAVDTFTGGFEGIEGDIEHTRAVLYIRGDYWVVVDHIATDRQRQLEVLWHFAPDITALIDENRFDTDNSRDDAGLMQTQAGKQKTPDQTGGHAQVFSDDAEKGNLRIVPAGNINWETEIVSGQTEPYIRGWYSESYGKKEPTPTVVYKTRIEEDAIFAWILIPADGKVPQADAEILATSGFSISDSSNRGTDEASRYRSESKPDHVQLKVRIEGKPSRFLSVPLDGGNPKIDYKPED